MMKFAPFMVLHKAMRLDPDSVEIRRRLASVGDGKYFHGDMVYIDAGYIYEAEDEGYGPSPARPTHPTVASPIMTTPHRPSPQSIQLSRKFFLF